LKLARALSSLVQALRIQSARFAVVGGLAASARGEARFTRDVDVAVAVEDDAGAEAIIFALTQRGYVVLASVQQEATGRLATARLRSPDGVICDLIFATCGIEQEVVESAEQLELFPGVTIPTATAEALLAMKTLSVSTKRPRDLEDIRAMVRESADLDEGLVRRLLATIERRGYARGQNLIEKWDRLRVDLGDEP
jgi:Nucleotidyl transferase AbiEii toxin, Type IV TA system